MIDYNFIKQLLKQLLNFFKDEKFLLVVLAIITIFIASLTIQGCSSYKHASSFDSLKIYNYQKDLEINS